jgi:HlyD family secretion protein
MAKRNGAFYAIALPLVVAGAAYAWLKPGNISDFGQKTGLSAKPATMVYETVAASKGQVRKVIATTGPVRALVTVSVGSQLSGQIETVKTDFNSVVKAGDVMATVDPKTYASRVAQAKADLAAAEAALVNQQAAASKADAVLRNAEQSFARFKGLAEKGLTPRNNFETATRDLEVARAEIKVSKSQIESAKATILQRKAQLNQAQIDLDRTEIRAPIAGTVISRTVDPGQTVAASLQAPELFKIAQDLSRIRLEAQVNEADVGAISDGNSVSFTVDAYPDRTFNGKVTQVRLAATEINNVVTYTVIIEASNDDRKLFPGMTANVEIEAAKRENVLRISNDALRYKPKVSATETSSSGQAGRDGGDRTQRLIDRLKGEVSITAEQEAAVRDALKKLSDETKAASAGATMGGPPIDFGAMRQRINARVEQALTPLLTDEQRKPFERWRSGRETAKVATLWVLGSDGKPEPKFVRLGLVDDKFSEILSDEVADGANVVVRAKEAAK